MLFSQYPYLNFSDYNLDWIIKMVKELMKVCDGLTEWKTDAEEELKALQDFADAITAGRFPDSMMRAFYDWVQRNVPDIISAAVKNVWFGLTDDGYFFAWIPDSWEDINFSTTGYDDQISGYDFGHLVLRG